MSRSQGGLEGVSGLRGGRGGVRGPLASREGGRDQIPQCQPALVQGLGFGLREAHGAHDAADGGLVLGVAATGGSAGGLAGRHATTVDGNLHGGELAFTLTTMRNIPGTNGDYRCETAAGGRDIYDRAGRYLGRVERSSDPAQPWMYVKADLTHMRFRTLAEAAEIFNALAWQARRAARAI